MYRREETHVLLKLNEQATATDLKSILAGSPQKVSRWVH
jgi:hypothetical protein